MDSFQFSRIFISIVETGGFQPWMLVRITSWAFNACALSPESLIWLAYDVAQTLVV